VQLDDLLLIFRCSRVGRWLHFLPGLNFGVGFSHEGFHRYLPRYFYHLLSLLNHWDSEDCRIDIGGCLNELNLFGIVDIEL
jgi:hypothetical protein